MTGRERANFVNTVRNQRIKNTNSEVEKLAGISKIKLQNRTFSLLPWLSVLHLVTRDQVQCPIHIISIHEKMHAWHEGTRTI